MEISNGCSETAPKFLCDGQFEIVKLNEDYYEEATEIFMKYFVANENVCTATNVRANPLALNEIEVLFREILKDNISFAAKHLESNRLAAININKILEPKSNCDLEEVFRTFKTPELTFIGEYLNRMENTYDMYKKLSIDCAMEVVFLSTRPEFERKGLARSLTAFSIEFARNFGNGLIPDADFPKHIQGKRPKAVCSVFTTKFTQIIGDKLDFEAVVKIPYSDIVYNGCKFSDKLDPIHVYSVFAVKKL